MSMQHTLPVHQDANEDSSSPSHALILTLHAAQCDLKYIDPSYMIRAAPTITTDRIYCKVRISFLIPTLW